MAGWHHWLNGCESEWTPGVGDGQGGLACCDSWGRKESDVFCKYFLPVCGLSFHFYVSSSFICSSTVKYICFSSPVLNVKASPFFSWLSETHSLLDYSGKLMGDIVSKVWQVYNFQSLVLHLKDTLTGYEILHSHFFSLENVKNVTPLFLA